MEDTHKTLYKLMILYMLERIDFSMTQTQISDFILGKGYADYFSFQGALAELVEADLIHAESVQNNTYYTATPEGEETLHLLGSRVSKEIRQDILAYLKENGIRMRDESSVLADYIRTTAGEYEVHCLVKEHRSTLVDLKISVPTEEQAKAVTLQWKKKCQTVYAYLMTELMRDEQDNMDS